MKSKYTGIVFIKEMTDAFRDRKTIITTLLLPLFLYPLMFFFMNGAFGDMMDTAGGKTTVAVMGSASAQVREILALNPDITIADTQDPMTALKDGDVTLVLEGTQVSGGKLDVRVIYDDKKNASNTSMSYIGTLITQYNQASVNNQLAEMGIDMESLSPVTFSAVDLAEATGEQDGGNAGMMLSMMLPMLLVILLAVGGMATASDLFAGEKERKTMEPLLCTRAGRTAILTGKLMAVTTFAILNVIATVVGLAMSYFLSPDFFSISDEAMGTVQALNLPIPTVVLTVLLVLIMALVFSCLHVVIATYARTTKEATTYGTFVMFISYIPVLGTMMMGAGDIAEWMMFVPVMNVVGSLKMLLGGIVNYGFLGGSIAVSAVFLVAVMALARWLFGKETIMLRTTG
ncbi:MAG: ABC transporter permease subunit [Oscillospiraceae bacterium]|jgi:sodium transport system permease protein|nr:ABC transporter permease subunit [Oscillospiraceae bacterium]